MWIRTLLLPTLVVLGGCAGGPAPQPCEVLSPPQVVLPQTRDDQRVEAQSSGDPTLGSSAEQDCQ